MPKNNLKNQPKADAPRAQILSSNPLQKRQVSFGVISVEKNTKSETLVIAREQSDRSNLRDASGLLLPPRRDRNDKGVIGRNFGFLILNFKFWHKVSAVALSLGIIATVVFFQFAPERMS